MSDQYTPPGTNPYTTRTDPNRPDSRVDVNVSSAPTSGRSESGFGSGILVAVVFVVVAIIAAAVFTNRDMFDTNSGTSAPGVTIENNVAPADAASPAADPAPAAPADAAPATAAPAADTAPAVPETAPAVDSAEPAAPDAAAPTPAPAAPANP